MKDGRYNAWTLSQMSLALPAHAQSCKRGLLSRIEHWQFGDSVGYKEFPDDTTHKVPLIAWCVWGKAATFGEVDHSEVDYLLVQQNSQDGWWGTYSNTLDKEYASTYATAITLVALTTVYQSSFPDDALKIRLKRSIRLASDWLKTHHNGPFWKDYPNHSGNVAVGLSGIVLLSLRRAQDILGPAGAVELSEFDREFLGSLDSYPVPLMAEFSEISGLTVDNGRIDHVRVYVLPSVLLGIASTHKSGKTSDVTEASIWLSDATDTILQSRDLVSDYPWVAAEYLIALDALLGPPK
ncbi:MAG: hypothetical protein M3552_14620 [Planctomycetota bacterium]|nr:hypothetical protein [Planctomycetaceae bacterium]MDQ3331864.1 hypothetical protein [Planctomycetota bacterium]